MHLYAHGAIKIKKHLKNSNANYTIMIENSQKFPFTNLQIFIMQKTRVFISTDYDIYI